MFVAFDIEALGILALAQLGQEPVYFLILTGLVFFARGEVYSLFPSTCAGTYGRNALAAIVALAVLRPMRMRPMHEDGVAAAPVGRTTLTAAA
jgi:hypothetical protein